MQPVLLCFINALQILSAATVYVGWQQSGAKVSGPTQQNLHTDISGKQLEPGVVLPL